MPSLPPIVVVQDLDAKSTFLASPAMCIVCVQTMNQSFPDKKKVFSGKIIMTNAFRVKVCDPLYDILRARCVRNLMFQSLKREMLGPHIILERRERVSTIWTVYPEGPQEKRCGAVDTAWMVEFELRDMFESVKLVVEFSDACFLDLQSNVFLKNSV